MSAKDSSKKYRRIKMTSNFLKKEEYNFNYTHNTTNCDWIKESNLKAQIRPRKIKI